MQITPWREVVIPHDDVISGDFVQAEFAADLNQVARGSAQCEYQNPALFFQRTFITEGMRLLLTSVAKRLSGKGGDPVIQLQTAFGGGKTHTMLAVYHMVKGEIPAINLMGLDKVLSSAGISSLPPARISVLDGVAIAPDTPRLFDGIKINTLWGRLAWDLGGAEGYALVEKSDKSGTSPGKEILTELISKYSPCVILIDELVAYFRQFEEGRSFSGGTFDSNLSFIQALTEAVKLVPTAVLLASLPESEKEVGDRRGQQSLDVLSRTFGRVQALWKPVVAEEAFEIVRRRLFGSIRDEAARDYVCNAYYEIYRNRAASFPENTQESRYLDRLKTSYPIHPEFFDRLYEDWASLQNFQRTRGVLKLMAKVVHQLWKEGNKDALIMPGNLPLASNDVENELAYYLPNGWHSVIESDIDGDRSGAYLLDNKDPRFGQISASRRLTRTIFLGSAPGSLKGGNRGIEKSRVLLGVIQPSQVPQLNVYEDAIRRLCTKLHFIGNADQRYWFGTVPNLRREMEIRREKIKQDQVLLTLRQQLSDEFARGDFAGTHIFPSTSEVMDDEKLRLIILPPQNHYSRTQPEAAKSGAQEFINMRGNSPRINKNRLIFLACDSMSREHLLHLTRELIAWKSIIEEAKNNLLNLELNQLREAEHSLDESKQAVRRSLSDAYRWILSPYQNFYQKTLSDIQWNDQQVQYNGSSATEAIVETLKDSEELIIQWAPLHLSKLLNEYFWKNEKEFYPAVELWQHFCQQLYLPRLLNQNVLKETIEKGSPYREFWGIAQGKNGDSFEGFSFGEPVSIVLDSQLLLIKPSRAADYERMLVEQSKRNLPGEHKTPFGNEDPVKTEKITNEPSTTGSRSPELKTRLYASYVLDVNSPKRSLDKILEAVVEPVRFKEGVKISINLEIEIEKGAGFSKEEVRAITENSNTYNLQLPSFEED